ncbi:MAG: hypothetical protein Q8P28_03600 [Deltaproteobacteria bacterium]|nr:hypothetical protein [Deltaproteobacteria bacterium]
MPVRKIAYLCGILFCVFIFMPSSQAMGIEGFPGSTWGILTHDTGGLTGSGAMGWVRQGIDWAVLPGDITVDTYVEYRYRSRTKQNEFYDAEGPAMGIELKKSIFALGADYYWERFPKIDKSSENRELYLTYYYGWDLKKLTGADLPVIEGLSGSIWGRLNYDAAGLTGSGTMGWINQGIDWVTFPGSITLNTYAEYRYRLRTKEKNYYNAEGPALGIEFRKSVFRLGMDYYWQRFPEIKNESKSLEIYLSWYYSWDLKGK